MILYRYHRFADRSAFLAACAAIVSALDPAQPVAALGDAAVIEVGTLSDQAEPPAPLPGYHACIAWRGAVPAAFQASVIPRPAGAPVFAGQIEAETAPPPGSDPPPADPVPLKISFAQAEILLSKLPRADSGQGTALDQVEEWVATQPPEIQILWRRGYELYRYSPNVIFIGGLIQQDLDWFFRTADRITG